MIQFALLDNNFFIAINNNHPISMSKLFIGVASLAYITINGLKVVEMKRLFFYLPIS